MGGVKTALQEVNELQYKQEQLECSNASLTHRVDRRRKRGAREGSGVCYNALEKARVGNHDLQVQLGHALQQALDPNSKGNSLFAEVDGQRAAMDSQLNSMKT